MKKLLLSGIVLVNMILHANCQNVGIGTNTPNFPLTVISQNNKGIVQKNADVEVGFYTSGAAAYLQTWSAHPLYFSTANGSAHMAILTNGNVGIGTATPTTKLDINGLVRIRGGNPVAGNVLTATDANGNAEWMAPGGGANKILNVSFASFFPTNSSAGWVNGGIIGRRPASAITGLLYFEAPLLVPAGSKLISIDWLFVDDDTKNFDFCVVYDNNYSTDPGNGVVIPGGCISSTVDNSVAQTITKSLNNHIMQNTPYYLRVGVTDWPINGNMYIKGARITYQ